MSRLLIQSVVDTPGVAPEPAVLRESVNEVSVQTEETPAVSSDETAIVAPPSESLITKGPVLDERLSTDTAVCLVDPHADLLASAQREDASLAHCFELAKKDQDSVFVIDHETKLLFRRWEHLSFTHYQLVVPTGSRNRILQLAHDEGGHSASRRTNLMIQYNFWWPRVRRDVKAYVQSCVTCQGRARITVHDRTPIVAVQRPAKSFEMLKCDILGPIEPKSTRGHAYVLGCVDVTTRWLELIAIKNVTSQEIISGLKSVFDRFGRPKILFTDNASYFTSKLSREVYEALEIEFQTSTQLKASQNGLIERVWGSVKHQLHEITSVSEAA